MKLSMYAALLLAMLCGAACSDQAGGASESSSQDEIVLGGTGSGTGITPTSPEPGPGPSPGPGPGSGPGTTPTGPAISVHHNFLTLTDGGGDNIGARGWSVPGPLIDYQIKNPGNLPLVLTGTPRVQVSNLINVSGMTVTQPQVTTIPPGQSASFGLVFTVDVRAAFSFHITIPSNAVIGQVGAAFDFLVKGEGAPQLFYGRWDDQALDAPGFYVNGAAKLNPEVHLANLQGASNRYLSPNGKFGVAAIDGEFTAFLTDDGTVNAPLPPLPPGVQEFGALYVWYNHAADEQWLGVIRRDITGRANHVYVYGITTGNSGGVNRPQVSLLGQVQMSGAPPLNTMNLSSLIWSKDGTRLAFRDLPDNPATQPAIIWGCVVTAGVPGVATIIGQINPQSRSQADADMAWSSNQVMLMHGASAAGSSLFRVTVDGSSGMLGVVETVTLADRVRNWRLSPDGARVAFDSWAANGSQWDTRPYGLEVSAAGGPPTPLLSLAVNHNAALTQVEWTPDGAGVVFGGTFTTIATIDIYFQRLTSGSGPILALGATVSLTHSTPGASCSFVISPEGARVAILTRTGSWPDYFFSIVLVTLASAPESNQLWVGSVTHPGWGMVSGLQFSPRGDFISFAAPHEIFPGQPAAHEIFLVPLSGPTLMKAGPLFTASENMVLPGVLDYAWLR